MVYSFNQFEISACAERGNGGGGGRNFLFGVKNHLKLISEQYSMFKSGFKQRTDQSLVAH